MNVSKEAVETSGYTSIKTKQCATWGSGDYARVGSALQVTGEHLAETLDFIAGEVVLDVAAGNGNMARDNSALFISVPWNSMMGVKACRWASMTNLVRSH